MRFSIVTPVDIKYSYKATEYLVYEYAKALKENGLDVELLITNTGKKRTYIKNYTGVQAKYKGIPQKPIDCIELTLPLKYHLFMYKGLPQDSVVYLPFSVYDYITNIISKPLGQKYIIGCHGMHLKMGHMVAGNSILEGLLNTITRTALLSRKNEMRNLYCHVINKEQAKYVRKELGFRPENIFYVPIMLDIKKYRIRGNKSHKLKVVHIGGAGKDMQIVLGVIDLLKAKGSLDGFDFYFIGESDKEAEETYRIFGNVNFLGMVGDKEKIKILSEMDAIIVPAYETFSKTMLEGLASGLYVLTSRRAASWRDLTKLGVKMTVTHDGRAEDYVQPLLKLHQMKKNGRDINTRKKENLCIISKEFDSNVVLKKIEEMFLTVAKHP